MRRFLDIALLQYDIKWLDIASNLAELDVFFRDIPQTIDMIVLPEMFSTGFTMDPAPVAQSMEGEAIRWLVQKSSEKQALIVGSLIIRSEEKYYNRCVLIYPDGTISYQDKRHLFSYAGEDETFTAAGERKVFEWLGWKLFCGVCYDLRFPVWSRNDEGYDVAIYVANWPESRIEAWDKLLMARAIENQSYVLAVNRVGVDGNEITYNGHSALIDYEGKCCTKQLNKSGVLYGKLDSEALKKYRDHFRFLEDRDDFNIV